MACPTLLVATECSSCGAPPSRCSAPPAPPPAPCSGSCPSALQQHQGSTSHQSGAPQQRRQQPSGSLARYEQREQPGQKPLGAVQARL